MIKKTLLLSVLTFVLGAMTFVAWHYVQPSEPLILAPADPLRTASSARPALRDVFRTAGDPDGARGLVGTGLAALQQARETGDGAHVARAEAAFQRVLEADAGDVEAMLGLAQVHLVRHQFVRALAWADRAVERRPGLASGQGIRVDALVELGRYDEAVEAAQTMVDLRPDQASLTRISYLRELHGDLAGAADAMQRAASAGSGVIEHTAWCHVYLGHLLRRQGRLDEAASQYRLALAMKPAYGHAEAGLGHVALALGQADDAVARFERAVEVLPIPEFVIALGHAQDAAGDAVAARRTWTLAADEIAAEHRGGMDVADELAQLLLEELDEPRRALDLARGAYERRPTVKNASLLGLALMRNGRAEEAVAYARESLRLGTPEPAFYRRAEAVARAVGDEALRAEARAGRARTSAG